LTVKAAPGPTDPAQGVLFSHMNETGQGRGDRREFLRGSARYALLTTLAALSAALFKHSGGKLSGQTCSNQGICCGCSAYAGCGLPAALTRKQATSGGRV
jgi:hypothetical protein